MSRTPAQIRLSTAHHEAAHATAAYLLGQRFEKIELVRPGEERAQGDVAGCVWLGPQSVSDIHAAEDLIVVYLAGECGMRVAWALETISDEDIGGATIPDDELSIEDLLAAAIPNGATPVQSAAYYGWLDRRGAPDEQNAEELAREWTSSLMSATQLMTWCRVRTVDTVNTERFQSLMGRLAVSLLRLTDTTGELDGEDAWAGLERADRIFELLSEKKGKVR